MKFYHDTENSIQVLDDAGIELFHIIAQDDDWTSEAYQQVREMLADAGAYEISAPEKGEGK